MVSFQVINLKFEFIRPLGYILRIQRDFEFGENWRNGGMFTDTYIFSFGITPVVARPFSTNSGSPSHRSLLFTNRCSWYFPIMSCPPFSLVFCAGTTFAMCILITELITVVLTIFQTNKEHNIIQFVFWLPKCWSIVFVAKFTFMNLLGHVN